MRENTQSLKVTKHNNKFPISFFSLLSNALSHSPSSAYILFGPDFWQGSVEGTRDSGPRGGLRDPPEERWEPQASVWLGTEVCVRVTLPSEAA